MLMSSSQGKQVLQEDIEKGIFSLRESGLKSVDFHNKCDGIAPTITLIQSE